jgi:hypothetical protein
VVVLKTGDEGTVTGASTSLFSSTKLKVSVSGSEHRLSPAELTKKLEVQTAADVMNAVEQAKAAAERAERAAIMAQRHDLGQLSALLETGLAGGASAVDAPLSAAEVAELRSLDPAMLAKVVARHADGEAAQVEVASILESPVLKIYYLTVLATVMSFLTGCEAVHSGIVAKAEWSASDEAGNFMKTALKGGGERGSVEESCSRGRRVCERPSVGTSVCQRRGLHFGVSPPCAGRRQAAGARGVCCFLWRPRHSHERGWQQGGGGERGTRAHAAAQGRTRGGGETGGASDSTKPRQGS